MARKAIGSEIVLNDENIEKVLSTVRELLVKHAKRIEENVQDSEDKTGTVNMALKVNASESAVAMKVTIRFSETTTDSRDITADDPNQPSLLNGEELEKTGKRGKAKKDADDTVATVAD